MFYDFSWLTNLMVDFGQSYPSTFENDFSGNIQALVNPFCFLLLFAFIKSFFTGGFEK